jgi:hypothetical protein
MRRTHARTHAGNNNNNNNNGSREYSTRVVCAFPGRPPAPYCRFLCCAPVATWYVQYNRGPRATNRDTAAVPDTTITVTYATTKYTLPCRTVGRPGRQQQQQQWIVIAVCELTKSWEGNVDYASVSIHAGRNSPSACSVKPWAPNDTIGTSQPTVWYNSTGISSPPSRFPTIGRFVQAFHDARSLCLEGHCPRSH